MKWLIQKIKYFILTRRERIRIRKVEDLRQKLIKLEGLDFRRLEREVNAIEAFFLGKTVNDRLLCMLIPEGQMSQKGDWYTSSMGGGLMTCRSSYKITDTSMPHFRPLTSKDMPFHWNVNELQEKIHERIAVEKDLNLVFPDIANNLEVLVEECAEVIQVKAKAFRFGLTDVHPVENKTNQKLLNTEVGQLLAMVDILKANGILDPALLSEARIEKIDKLQRWYGMTKVKGSK